MKKTLPNGQSAAILGLLAVALPVVPLVASIRSPPIIFGVLNQFAHAPVFGALAAVIFRLLGLCKKGPVRTRILLAFLASFAAGGIVEMLQPVLGRSADLVDLRTNALGAGAGLLIVALTSSRHRCLPSIALAVLILAVTWPVGEAVLAYRKRLRQFPAILEITSPFDSYFIRTSGFELSAAALPPRWRRTEDRSSLRLRAVNIDPSFTHLEPEPDWRNYTSLNIDLTNPTSRPITLTLRVHDRAHDNRFTDRFNKRVSLKAGTRKVFVIQLSDIEESPIGRDLDLSRIAGVIIFGSNDPEFEARELYLSRIWLE